MDRTLYNEGHCLHTKCVQHSTCALLHQGLSHGTSVLCVLVHAKNGKGRLINT